MGLTHHKAQNSDKIKLQLEADGKAGLYPILSKAFGKVIHERFLIQNLFAVGRQTFVFSAHDQKTDQKVILKQAAFDYRNPIQYSRRDVDLMRQALQISHQVQSDCQTDHMSRPIAFFTSDALVPAAKQSRTLAQNEVFLVEEYLQAWPIFHMALNDWTTVSEEQREKAVFRVIFEFINFWNALCQAGWVYIDVNAFNLLIDQNQKLKIVDAASALPFEKEITLSNIAPAFATPNIWKHFQSKTPVKVSLAIVLPLLAKLVHFVLTRKEPWNAILPNLEEPSLAIYSQPCRETLLAMLEIDAFPEKIAFATNSLKKWGLFLEIPE